MQLNNTTAQLRVELERAQIEIERLRAALERRIEVATNLQMRNDELLTLLKEARYWVPNYAADKMKNIDAAIAKAEGDYHESRDPTRNLEGSDGGPLPKAEGGK